jgi:cytochrome bd ubiquinol oxidase subunit II
MTLLDYETLRVIWWVLLGVLLIAFAVMDGFDLGSGMLLLFVARGDGQRRMVINAIGPVWEGNQVWLILGAGAIFAAWPLVYATAFSGFYLAMILALSALIIRPVAIVYRSKMPGAHWRRNWDFLLFLASSIPPLVFGVALGNTLEGAPFQLDQTMRLTYSGSLLDLFNPFALLTGVVSLAMTAMHGAAYLAAKTEESVAFRARIAGFAAALILIVLFAAAGYWVATGLPGYRITGVFAHDAASNPLAKTVVREAGAWIANYRAMPWMMIAPGLGFLGAALAALALALGHDRSALTASGLGVFGVVATVGVSMFPFILPSSLDPASSLTVWDASSSQSTLFTMLIATVLFLPLILIYTAFIYRVLRGRVSEKDVEADHASY